MWLPVILEEHVSAIDTMKAKLLALVAVWKVNRGVTTSVHILALGILPYFAIVDIWIKGNLSFSKSPCSANLQILQQLKRERK